MAEAKTAVSEFRDHLHIGDIMVAILGILLYAAFKHLSQAPMQVSRHGYEEAVWDQTLETFLRLHEHALTDLGGVPRVIRHDNMKAAVVRACLYDPDVNVIYAAFAKHWGFTPLPIRPCNPQENGKQERSGGYVEDNALKGAASTVSPSRTSISGAGTAPKPSCSDAA